MQKAFKQVISIMLGITLAMVSISASYAGENAEATASFDNQRLTNYADEQAETTAPESATKTFLKQRLTNVADIVIFTIAATVMTHCLDKLGCASLSAKQSLALGTCTWLVGEIAETIYKKVYEHITQKNLRETLGKTEISGIEINHQRLMRRCISLATLFITLYIQEKAFESYANHRD
jgi:hypothetical protein